MKKKNILFITGIVVFLVSAEVILRTYFGFTHAILFREDKSIEYIPVPQHVFRFRKHNFYNSYSQRNREINSSDSLIVLGFGDSVLNGGAQTDQDSLATTLLSNYISKKQGKIVLFTNISAGSWGPDNCYAYLKKYGNFHAKSILLVVSSHDAYDNINFEKVVGIHQNYPDKQYKSAIAEIIGRYIYPQYIEPIIQRKKQSLDKNNTLMISKYKKGMSFNRGFSEFKRYCDSTKIPLLIYLHADKQELKSMHYNEQGEKIINFCLKNNLHLVKELNYRFHSYDYRDDIHLSERGQRAMFSILKDQY
jgi:hypothetical protein